MMLLKFFSYSTANVSLVTVLFCLCFLPLSRRSAPYAVTFPALIQDNKHYEHYAPLLKGTQVLRKENPHRIAHTSSVASLFLLASPPCAPHECYVEGFYIKFSPNTNELNFIAIKTSEVLYISKEFVLAYNFFLEVLLPTAVIQASVRETIPPALFDAASLWRPESQGFSHRRATSSNC